MPWRFPPRPARSAQRPPGGAKDRTLAERLRGDETSDWEVAVGDDHLLATFHHLNQRGGLGLGLVDFDRQHCRNPGQKLDRAMATTGRTGKVYAAACSPPACAMKPITSCTPTPPLRLAMT